MSLLSDVLDAPSFSDWFRGTAVAFVRVQALERGAAARCEPVESPMGDAERFEFEADGFMPEWAADRLAVEWAAGGAL